MDELLPDAYQHIAASKHKQILTASRNLLYSATVVIPRRTEGNESQSMIFPTASTFLCAGLSAAAVFLVPTETLMHLLERKE